MVYIAIIMDLAVRYVVSHYFEAWQMNLLNS